MEAKQNIAQKQETFSLHNRLRYLRRSVLNRLLEDQAHRGLGGPPNNWHHSPNYTSRQHGMSTGIEYFSLSFTNDAFDVGLWIQWQEGEGKWDCMIAAEDFRKVAIWYLWRWAWGEWFGLRRRLFYIRLHKQVEAMRKVSKPE